MEINNITQNNKDLNNNFDLAAESLARILIQQVKGKKVNQINKFIDIKYAKPS